MTIFSGCADESKSTSDGRHVVNQEQQEKELQRQKQLEMERIEKEKQEREQRERERREREEREAANIFAYSNYTLSHTYIKEIPYNSIKISFIVQNTSNKVQRLRLRDFVLRKEGYNTISPEEAMRNYTGIARNPENPDFSDYEKDLNEREMFPGDRFMVNIEFWEDAEVIRSLEGWTLYHMYDGKAKPLGSLQD